MPIEQANALHASRLAALRAEFAMLWQTWPTEITLEIGCGHGHFLNAYAQAHPDEHCLGLDLLADRIARAQKKARRAGLTNLAFFHAEARLLLEALPAPVRLGRIFILFPDPWPKRRHHKNRIMQPEFLQTLATRAGQGPASASARITCRISRRPAPRSRIIPRGNWSRNPGRLSMRRFSRAGPIPIIPSSRSRPRLPHK